MSPAERPIVAVVGRPNVGKSTLVNRIVGGRVAIVEERPGITRDRLELEANWAGHDFVLVDTGGVIPGAAALDAEVTAQSLRAAATADVIVLVVDASVGVTGEDAAVADALRSQHKPTLVVANKVDASDDAHELWSFLSLGYGEPWAVSALHGRQTGDFLDGLVAAIDEANANEAAVPAETDDGVLASVAIVGRPNVGKSTLFNRLVGEERTIVHDVPGTTRDAIDTIVETEAGLLRFVDTAGLRRRAKIDQPTEYYSLVRSLIAIDRSDVALLVLDATDGVTGQDQRIAERVDTAGSALVIVCNKWDLCDTEQRLALARQVAEQLGFVAWAPLVRISAKTGHGVARLVPAIGEAIEAYQRRIPTAELNQAVRAIQSAHPAPGGRILYAVQGAVEPPTVTLFANHRLPAGYLRYVDRSLRERFALGPTALKLRVRVRG